MYNKYLYNLNYMYIYCVRACARYIKSLLRKAMSASKYPGAMNNTNLNL